MGRPRTVPPALKFHRIHERVGFSMKSRIASVYRIGLWHGAGVALGFIMMSPAGRGADFASERPAVRIEPSKQRLAEITSDLGEPRKLSAVRLVFLGASITEFWHIGDSPWVPGKKYGKAIWDESFAGRPAQNLGLNLGIAGDRTEHLLFRLLPRSAGGLGELDARELDPEFIIVQVGTNNTFEPESPMVRSVFEGIRAVVAAAHERKPKATVIVQSLLPGRDGAKNRDVVHPVNQRLAELPSIAPFSDYLVYLDVYALFVDSAGRRMDGLFNDNLHPNESGYRIWRDRLVSLLDQRRASRSVRAAAAH